MIFLIRETGDDTGVRPTKVSARARVGAGAATEVCACVRACDAQIRSMLASRACRSSVMIGDALDDSQMRAVRFAHACAAVAQCVCVRACVRREAR